MNSVELCESLGNSKSLENCATWKTQTGAVETRKIQESAKGDQNIPKSWRQNPRERE